MSCRGRPIFGVGSAIIYFHWLIQPTVRLITRIAVGKPIASGGRFAPEPWSPPLPGNAQRPPAQTHVFLSQTHSTGVDTTVLSRGFGCCLEGRLYGTERTFGEGPLTRRWMTSRRTIRILRWPSLLGIQMAWNRRDAAVRPPQSGHSGMPQQFCWRSDANEPVVSHRGKLGRLKDDIIDLKGRIQPD